jgi:hypothetical protein
MNLDRQRFAGEQQLEQQGRGWSIFIDALKPQLSCHGLIRSLYGLNFSEINEVSYRTGDVIWVHVSHPSGLNGHHPAWMAADPSTKPARKRDLAIKAIRSSGAIREN